MQMQMLQMQMQCFPLQWNVTDVDLCSKYCVTDKPFPWSGHGFTVIETVAVKITVSVYFAISHMRSHTSQHSTHPTPHTALQNLPLHPFLSLFRVQRDWESGRIPVHHDTHAQLLCIWWRECPYILPVTTGMGPVLPSLLHVLCRTQWKFHTLSAM